MFRSVHRPFIAARLTLIVSMKLPLSLCHSLLSETTTTTKYHLVSFPFPVNHAVPRYSQVVIQCVDLQTFRRLLSLVFIPHNNVNQLSSFCCLSQIMTFLHFLISLNSDNELSPECLDGCNSFLRSDAISIPSSYSSYVAPVQSAKLHANVKSYREDSQVGHPTD